MRKRSLFAFASVPLILVLASNFHVAAKDAWVSVRSPHFLLIGNGSEKEVKQVGTRLEQFREAISRMFKNLRITSQVPTTVIVFKSHSTFRPFKVRENNAGFFQSGPDVNYIALTTEVEGDQDPFTIIFHEYTHLLVSNTVADAPPWFNEGLAEYYSTFTISNDQRVIIGKPISSHVFLLRKNRMLPLRALFQVDHKSPYYNEREKQSIFYAQSWAFMHYLLLNKDEHRAVQLTKFIDLITAKVATEQAFTQAFQTSFQAMEAELNAYVKQDQYPIIWRNFESKLEIGGDMQSAPISEAEAMAYLGDMLLHCQRAEAEIYLRKALSLDPNLALAHASLGMFLFKQGKPEEARASLERAVAANSQNYLIHYYYAYVLGRPPVGEALQLNLGYSPEVAARIRTELKKAIALRPDYPESYNLLAFVNLVTNTDIDESIAMLQDALTKSPGRVDFQYMLGQLYMNKDDYRSAKPVLEFVAAADIGEEVRSHARKLVQTINEIEEQRAKRAAERANSGMSDEESMGVKTPTANDPSAALRIAIRGPAAGEAQIQGTLVRIECDPKNFIFIVRVNEKLLKLRTQSFEKLRLTTYDDQVRGTVTCGARQPETSVVVNYVPANDKLTKTDGVMTSLNFVPADFKLTP